MANSNKLPSAATLPPGGLTCSGDGCVVCYQVWLQAPRLHVLEQLEGDAGVFPAPAETFHELGIDEGVSGFKTVRLGQHKLEGPEGKLLLASLLKVREEPAAMQSTGLGHPPHCNLCCPHSACANSQAQTLRSACAAYGAHPKLSQHAGLDAK